MAGHQPGSGLPGSLPASAQASPNLLQLLDQLHAMRMGANSSASQPMMSWPAPPPSGPLLGAQLPRGLPASSAGAMWQAPSVGTIQIGQQHQSQSTVADNGQWGMGTAGNNSGWGVPQVVLRTLPGNANTSQLASGVGMSSVATSAAQAVPSMPSLPLSHSTGALSATPSAVCSTDLFATADLLSTANSVIFQSSNLGATDAWASLSAVQTMNSEVEDAYDANLLAVALAQHQHAQQAQPLSAPLSGRDLFSAEGVVSARNSDDASGAPGAGATNANKPHVISSSLYIKNLPPDANELFLYQRFAPYGAVLSCRVHIDPVTGRCKGAGFVNFVENACAVRAMQSVHGTRTASGHKLHVTLQVPRSMRVKAGNQTASTPGAGGGAATAGSLSPVA